MIEFLKVENIVKRFPVKSGFFESSNAFIHALNGISFSTEKGKTIGLVGESGCGKSTLAKIIARLLDADEGKIIFEGKDITNLKEKQFKNIRSNIQFIFQDPHSSLNPRMNILQILSEPFTIHKIAKGNNLKGKIKKLLELVGLEANFLYRYPHEFSGGQRQRIGIARAIALNPKLVVADEPIASLDISIQAQILNLLLDLQEKLGLTYIFISHDLRIIEHISDKVVVMYLGKIMEIADSIDLYKHPMHPYTQALMSAIPVVDRATKKKRVILKGEIPSSTILPAGCVFHTRCIYAKKKCIDEIPALSQRGNRYFACHFPL